MEAKKKSSFTGSLGFVLAAAGSAVGVGNIWRFPYLAAKDGGGLFLIIYLALVLTFGFTLLVTDVAIGRRTKTNALHAFGKMQKKWSFLGYLILLRSGHYHDLLLRHRQDGIFKVSGCLSYRSGKGSRPGRIFYRLYHLTRITCGFHADLFMFYRTGRIPRGRKGH